MGRHEKLIARLKSRPRNFSWDELTRLLTGLGYAQVKTGKTGGSRRRFVHPTAPVITLHKPHSGKIVKLYVVDAVTKTLTDENLI